MTNHVEKLQLDKALEKLKKHLESTEHNKKKQVKKDFKPVEIIETEEHRWWKS